MHESDEHDFLYGGAGGGLNRAAEERTVTTIGVDVGSSTFHFMFSALHLRRTAGRQGRFAVTKREVLWRSPVYLTPYADGGIDAVAVSTAIGLGHQAARIPVEQVESGALILTGDALRAENAQALASEIESLTGHFMSVSAGDNLEAMLAALGSGAVGIARSHGQRLLHVDIGGGTTKFAVIDETGVRQTAAINGGGRIVAFDGDRQVIRLGAGAAPIAKAAGVDVRVGSQLSEKQALALAEVLAEAVTDVINGQTNDTAESNLRLTPSLDNTWRPEAISFSGGVSEYIYGREHRNFGDIGVEVGEALRSRFDEGRIALPLVEPGEGIRATVIGAAQSATELSGNAVEESADAVLPLNNVLVLHPDIESNEFSIEGSIAKVTRLFGVRGTDPVALSISWEEHVTDEKVAELAHAIKGWSTATARKAPTIILLEQKVADQLQRALSRDAKPSGPIICLDGIHLSSLDYVDVGKRLGPAGMVPLVIKSLLFDVQDQHHHIR